jgi:hypothetical protein
LTGDVPVHSGLRRGAVVCSSSSFTGSQLSLELLASVKVLTLLTGAAPALAELVLSLLAALRELSRHEARRLEPGVGVGIDADESESDRRDVCSITPSIGADCRLMAHAAAARATINSRQWARRHPAKAQPV